MKNRRIHNFLINQSLAFTTELLKNPQFIRTSLFLPELIFAYLPVTMHRQNSTFLYSRAMHLLPEFLPTAALLHYFNEFYRKEAGKEFTSPKLPNVRQNNHKSKTNYTNQMQFQLFDIDPRENCGIERIHINLLLLLFSMLEPFPLNHWMNIDLLDTKTYACINPGGNTTSSNTI